MDRGERARIILPGDSIRNRGGFKPDGDGDGEPRPIDPKAVADAAEAERIRAAWIEWLRRIHWTFFVTGTSSVPVIGSTWRRIVERWLKQCRSPETCGAVGRCRCSGELYAAVGLQRGPIKLKPHVHLLVGIDVWRLQRMRKAGEPEPMTTTELETHLRGSWIEDGHVRVDPFTPKRGGVEYLARQTDVIEIVGTPELYRRRRRGSRGGRSHE